MEIGTEELPPKALRSLAESFAANFTAELDNANAFCLVFRAIALFFRGGEIYIHSRMYVP
ncbi:hypothetical protein AC599_21280 [Yersinia pestis subsp. microtus bv. Altaica]|nr:hypothetical protein AC599_21280 [Yersinia pestis subsp. microtus bv. Altaica]